MTFWNRKEGKETNEVEGKPRNQILQTPESSTAEAKEKLDPSERKQNDFSERLKVPNNTDKEKLIRKASDGNTSAEGDPTKGQRLRERGNETQFER